jgi:hypothetical protein
MNIYENNFDRFNDYAIVYGTRLFLFFFFLLNFVCVCAYLKKKATSNFMFHDDENICIKVYIKQIRIENI